MTGYKAPFVCSNLHVVSVSSVGHLRSFVDSMHQLFNGPLHGCRILFVDDLDLGALFCRVDAECMRLRIAK